MNNFFDWEEDVESYARRKVEEVSITYHSYGFYACRIKRFYVKKLPVEVVNSSPKIALKHAKELVEEVENFEKEHGLLEPENDNAVLRGYSHRMYGENEVEFKKYHSGYVITRITRKDENEYRYVKEPHSPNGYYSKDLSNCRFGDAEKEKSFLKDGEELWMYDNIGYLCGTAGFAVIKNGLVIKLKCVLIS